LLPLFDRKRETRSFRTKTLHMYWTFSSVSFSLSMLLCLLNRLFISLLVNLSTFGKHLVSKVVLFLILALLEIYLPVYISDPNINLMSCAYIFMSLSLILKTSSSLMYVCKIWYTVRSFFWHICLSILPFKIHSITVQNGVLNVLVFHSFSDICTLKLLDYRKKVWFELWTFALANHIFA